MSAEPYISNARDAIVAYCGGSSGCYRTRCVTCFDATPLTDPDRVYGDCYVPTGPLGSVDDTEACDTCGVTIADLSARCQREHDDQQRRWARESRIDHVIEMGMVAAVRCRVY